MTFNPTNTVLSRRQALKLGAIWAAALAGYRGLAAPAGTGITTITGARVFDGQRVRDNVTVVLDGPRISAVGGPVPPGSTIIDARGATLLPGLIDAHVHTSPDYLRSALLFGVTTQLEMGGEQSAETRAAIIGRDDMADYRSAGISVTAQNGHPAELFPQPKEHDYCQCGTPSAPPISAADAADVVDELVAGGSDYIKIIIEEGTVFGAPGLPMLSDNAVAAAVRAAHRHDKLAIAHALTYDATEGAVAAGMDGLAHVFIDRPHTPELVGAIADSGAFVTPCLVLVRTAIGRNAAELADDERVSSRLSPEWLDTLRSSVNSYPQGDFSTVQNTVAALHAAGVDILVGTDAVRPGVPGGVAHGASVHHELQLLVAAGLTPTQALAAATSVPARRFGLGDRGQVVPGARADLLLVDGDPTTSIVDTLNTRAVWRRGTQVV